MTPGGPTGHSGQAPVTPVYPGHNTGHKFHLAFDETSSVPDESHMSTPRKVIREIIV